MVLTRRSIDETSSSVSLSYILYISLFWINLFVAYLKKLDGLGANKGELRCQTLALSDVVFCLSEF